MKKPNRRNFLGKGLAAGAGAATVAITTAVPAKADAVPVKRVIYKNGKKPEGTPVFNSTVAFGNLVFIAGVGAHPGEVPPNDVKASTKLILDSIQKQLEAAGSSMDKVLKANVYLNDIKDWAAMNEEFKGRFGPEPPVRTTIAAPGGIPGDSLVEIDVIACL